MKEGVGEGGGARSYPSSSFKLDTVGWLVNPTKSPSFPSGVDLLRKWNVSYATVR